MKKIILLIGFFLFLISCEKPNECFESTGEIIVRDFPVSTFTKIKVYRGISIVITQGMENKVQVKTGSNSIDNIEITQIGNQLVLKDNTTCNWLREYGQTTVYITAPNIEEIYSKTERNISSNGVLTYANLKIISFDKNADFEEGAGTGDFYLNINNINLDIENNNVSRYYISGNVQNLTLNFWAGDGRVEAQDCIAQNIYVYHRGTNDMVVRPIQTLNGNLYSTGNLICKGYPAINPQVTVHYQGQLIFE